MWEWREEGKVGKKKGGVVGEGEGRGRGKREVGGREDENGGEEEGEMEGWWWGEKGGRERVKSGGVYCNRPSFKRISEHQGLEERQKTDRVLMEITFHVRSGLKLRVCF